MQLSAMTEFTPINEYATILRFSLLAAKAKSVGLNIELKAGKFKIMDGSGIMDDPEFSSMNELSAFFVGYERGDLKSHP